jgi:hypothetical protein
MSSEILDCCNFITWISPDTEILITGKFQQTRDESCINVYTFSDYCSGRQPLQVRRATTSPTTLYWYNLSPKAQSTVLEATTRLHDFQHSQTFFTISGDGTVT